MKGVGEVDWLELAEELGMVKPVHGFGEAALIQAKHIRRGKDW